MTVLQPRAASLADARDGRARRRRSRGRLLLLAVVFTLLAAELILRLTGAAQPGSGARTPQQSAFHAARMFVPHDDAVMTYLNRPLAREDVAGIAYHHDEHGFRIAPEQVEGSAGEGSGDRAPRIAFLGDSTTYGLGLGWDDTVPAVTVSALAARGAARDAEPVAARNLGVCGFTTEQEVALWEQLPAARQDAVALVLLVFPNDFAPGRFLYDEDSGVLYADPLPLPASLKPLAWHSALYRALSTLAAARTRAEYDPLLEANRVVTLRAIERLAEVCRRDGLPLLVAHLPAMERLDPYVFAAPVEALAARCAEL